MPLSASSPIAASPGRARCRAGTGDGSRAGTEAGSVLALIPAGFLVLILLGALAVDSAVAYLGQQQLHDALSAAANDAVGAGVDDRAFYRQGIVVLDPAAVEQTVCASIAAQGDTGLHQLTVQVSVSGDSVLVTGSASVDGVFGRALPGFGTRSVRSSASATLSEGGPPASAGSFSTPVALSCP